MGLDKDNKFSTSQRTVYEPGACIFAEGDERDNAYIIERGKVEITGKVDGKTETLIHLSEGELFGEMALISKGARSATATATEETELLVITQEKMRERMHNIDPIAGLLMRLLVERYRNIRHEEGSLGTDEDLFAPLKAGEVQQDIAIMELKMEKELRHAIEERQFVPYFQPIVKIPGKEVVGFETLIRWEHPERGMVPPGEFIPVSERTGTVLELDMLMLRRSCEVQPDLEKAAGKPVFISVNLSGVHFGNRDVVGEVEKIINDTAVYPDRIKLEITESALIGDPKMAANILERLKALGVHIVLDDFGTGYSSLGYLHKFAIDTIKVDQEFVRQIHVDHKSLGVVRAIVGLAKTFNQDVVAEGIEQEDELIALGGIGCDYGQGYFFSKPMSFDDTLNFIENQAA